MSDGILETIVMNFGVPLKGREFIDHLNDYQYLKKDSVPCS
jgi:hypothetical protein